MNWQQVGGNIIGWCLWQCYQASLFGVRYARKGTISAMPKPKAQQEAIRNAAIAAGAWTIGLGVVFVLFAGTVSGFLIGAIVGAAIGLYCALAVYRHGLQHAAAGGDAIQLGHTRDRYGLAVPVAIDRESRVRHVAVFGATGSGKSTALKNIVLQDAAAPERPGILCIDIKDDFALSLTEQLPADRQPDIVLFDPTDREHPPAFNPLADIDPKERALAAAELLGAFKRLYGDSWGSAPRLEHVMRHVLLTLVETPNATLLDINRLLTDAQYRAYALSHVTNFSVQDFWENEYDSIVGKGGSLANVASLLNKLSVFSYPEVRNVIGQTTRGLDFDQAMAEGKIVMAHLPQGVLGEDISSFFAALLVGKVQLAAQRRVQLAHRDRKPFYVFADEFQNYDTSAFTKLITEGRSMGVGLVVACQYREQLPSELRYAIEKNCAYALFCAREDKRYVIEVVKQQEPNAWDAERLVTALPPAGGRVPAQGVAVRNQSRALLSQPVQVVETAILARRERRSPSTVTPTETIDTLVVYEETMTIELEPLSAPPPVEGEVIATNGHTPNTPAADEMEVAECGACGTPVVATDAFCASCGVGRQGHGRAATSTSIMHQQMTGGLAMGECDACATPVVATDAFCASCGAGFQPAPPNGRTEPL
jgi:hypothetical protein